MVKTAVKFWKGNLESVAQMVHAYNKAIDYSVPEIEKLMVEQASRLLNDFKNCDSLETMCILVKKVYGEPTNVEFYFHPSHSNFIPLEYKA